tara:strand:- start:84 stop:686 length:603 start_codon:yes stop_codon:yes gene_type:complete
MMSWNTRDDVGYLTARDSDVIGHERTGNWNGPDGIFCSVHGGVGNLNNYLFDDIRIEHAQWAVVSVQIKSNNWSPPSPLLGNISTVILRNVSITSAMKSPTPFRIIGNSTKNARVDTFVFDGVTMVGGKPLTKSAVDAGGVGVYATNITVCEEGVGCADRFLPRAADEWTKDEICGRKPQPFVDGEELPPIQPHDEKPYC